MKNEILDFFEKNPIQYLATIGLDGKPKVRPFQFMLEEDEKFYFCTCNKKNVFKEMEKNSYVEFCAMDKDMNWVRTSGKVVITKDLDIKKKIIEKNKRVKEIYKSYDNPIFEVFYLEEMKYSINRIANAVKEESNL